MKLKAYLTNSMAACLRHPRATDSLNDDMLWWIFFSIKQQQQQQPSYGLLSRTTWDSRYQKWSNSLTIGSVLILGHPYAPEQEMIGHINSLSPLSSLSVYLIHCKQKCPPFCLQISISVSITSFPSSMLFSNKIRRLNVYAQNICQLLKFDLHEFCVDVANIQRKYSTET